ncbi:unhealthy ribosome biogenesis protein 2 homolog isoform X2 [Nematostella vectensis]|uniref:unhealthy ribosome biogenesis protein 2 homolog isoform X2 n=1 Tax=Nematostella vectensis TaxID=45351 RepID=UPI0020776811|nr:unhealthy ribosome biogenesis protein 2 homolog isoform X2 [Nematostella vectensis]
MGSVIEMDVTKGVYQKLKNPSISQDEKISLVSSAWQSDKCFIPNKHQVLLDWVCQEIINSYKKDFRATEKSSSSLKGLWIFTVSLLENLAHQISTVSVVIKPHLLQVFTDLFTQQASNKLPEFQPVVQCCILILTSDKLATSWLTKFESFVHFVSSVLLASASSVHLQDDILSLLQVSLQKYIPLQRKQSNHKKLFERFCEHLLNPMMQVHYKIVSEKATSSNIQTKICECVGDALFRRDPLLEFPSALRALSANQEGSVKNANTSPSKRSHHGSYPIQLFKTLRLLLTDDPWSKESSSRSTPLANFFPQLLREFLKARRSIENTAAAFEFHFFIELCALLGVSPSDPGAIANTRVLHLVHDMLSTLHAYDVYQVAEDNTSGAAQLKWFSEFTKQLTEYQPSVEVFDCHTMLLKMNHRILEPHLQDILKQFWMNCNFDERLEESQDIFLTSLVQVYSKLRQFDRFVHHLLGSLKVCSVSTPWKGFLSRFTLELVTHCETLPIGSVVGVWTVLCDEIENECVPAVSASSKMEAFYHLERVVSLLQVFLLNTSFGDVTEHKQSKEATATLAKLFQRSVEKVLIPLIKAQTEVANKKCRVSLQVFSLVVLQILRELEAFLSRFSVLNNAEESSLLLDDHWRVMLSQYRGKKEDPRVRYLMARLCMHEIRMALMNDTRDSQMEVLVGMVCDWTIGATPTPVSWTGQVWTINQSNLPVTLWHVISTCAVVLLPQCSQDQRLSITRYLMLSLTTAECSKYTEGQGLYTANSISRELVHSSVFHEIPSIQTALLISLWQRVGHSLSNLPSAITLVKLLQGFSSAGIEETSMRCVSTVQAEVPDVDMDKSESALNHWKSQIHGTVSTFSRSDSSDDESSESITDDEVATRDDVTENDAMENDVTKTPPITPPLPSLISSLVANARKVIADLLQKTDNQPSLSPEGLNQLEKELEFLSVLPLDWLTDLNHVTCVLALLACDVFAFRDCSQGFHEASLKVSFLCRRLLTVVVRGCLSRKRYLICHAIDTDQLLLRLVESMLCVTTEELTSLDLLCSVLRLALKNASQETSTSTFTSQMCSKLSQCCEAVESSKKVTRKVISRHEPVIKIASAILQVLREVLALKTSRLKEIKMAAIMATTLAPSVIAFLELVARPRRRKRKHSEPGDVSLASDNCASILEGNPVLVDCYASVLHMFVVSQNSRKLAKSEETFAEWRWKKIFPAFLKFATDFLNTRNKDFTEAESRHCITSCLRLLTVISSSVSMWQDLFPEQLYSRMLTSILHLLTSIAHVYNDVIDQNDEKHSTGVGITRHDDVINDVINPGDVTTAGDVTCIPRVSYESGRATDMLREEGMGVVVALLRGAEAEKKTMLLKALVKELRTSSAQSTKRLTALLQLWSYLLKRKITKENKKDFRPVLPEVLMALQFVVQQQAKTPQGTRHRLIALDIMTSIVTLGTTMVAPHHARLVLHSSLLVASESYSTHAFPAIFQSLFALLSPALYYQSEAMYGCVHVFVTCVNNMLRMLANYCCSFATKPQGDHSPGHDMTCAQKIARLYQEIATHKTAFSKYSPYLIAEYIHVAQGVHLPSHVKEVLTDGVFCLLDLCGDHETALLHATLSKGSRELFKTLNEEYNKYHKFTGKV